MTAIAFATLYTLGSALMALLLQVHSDLQPLLPPVKIVFIIILPIVVIYAYIAAYTGK
jgi:hypothetical protein